MLLFTLAFPWFLAACFSLLWKCIRIDRKHPHENVIHTLFFWLYIEIYLRLYIYFLQIAGFHVVLRLICSCWKPTKTCTPKIRFYSLNIFNQFWWHQPNRLYTHTSNRMHSRLFWFVIHKYFSWLKFGSFFHSAKNLHLLFCGMKTFFCFSVPFMWQFLCFAHFKCGQVVYRLIACSM